jgi:hypothetical protein
MLVSEVLICLARLANIRTYSDWWLYLSLNEGMLVYDLLLCTFIVAKGIRNYQVGIQSSSLVGQFIRFGFFHRPEASA